MNPAQSFDDAVAEEILRAVLRDDQSKEDNAAAENSEWVNARLSECYND